MTDAEKLLWGAVVAVVVAIVVAVITGIFKLLSGKQSDRILLKGNLEASADIAILNTIGCAGLILRRSIKTCLAVGFSVLKTPFFPVLLECLSITCKSKRPAKIKEAYIAMVVGPEFIESFAKGFSFPLGQGCDPDLPAPTCIVKLIPISKQSNKDVYVLERDDVCKFIVPIGIPFLHMFTEAPSEHVSICIKYMNDDEVVLMKGLKVQHAIRGLITIHGSLPMNLKKPLSVKLKFSTTRPPEACGIIGKTNPNPIEFFGGNEGK